MPHLCVRCNAQYPDDSDALLSGCACGAKAFVFVKDERRLDLDSLFRGELIYREEDGKYLIDLEEGFRRQKRR